MRFGIRTKLRKILGIAAPSAATGVAPAADAAKPMDYTKHRIMMWAGVRVHSCRKEPETVKWIETSMKPSDVLFDIGANVGAYSLITAKFHQGNVRVYAFEPAFQTFPLLVRNIILNDCSETIYPAAFPVGPQMALSQFNYRTLDVGSSDHAFGSAVNYKGESFKPAFSQMALGCSLDQLTSTFGLPVPTHIKLDVDGLELDIMRGGVKTLSDPHFRSLLVEGGRRNTDADLCRFAESCGLRLAEQHHHPDTDNFIFVRA